MRTMFSSSFRLVAWLAGATATLLLVGCAENSSETAIIELQIGTVTAPGSLVSITSEEFVRRVNERLEGRARAIFFGSSQLGNDEILVQKLKLGTLDFAVPSTIMSSLVDEFGLFEMPYLVRDRDHMRKIGEEVFWPQLAPAAEAKGYKVLGLWENGFRHITNNIRPIYTPEDLAGIKLRTPRGAWRFKLFRVFGANPTPMPLSEVFVALQTGVIDGQENPFAQLSSLKFQEVQTYLSLTGHVYSPSYLLTGFDRWNRLPEDIRQVIEQIAGEMQDFVYSEPERMDRELLEELRGSGIQINEADRERFLEASGPIYEEFGSTVAGGADMIQTVIQLASP